MRVKAFAPGAAKPPPDASQPTAMPDRRRRHPWRGAPPRIRDAS
jgi:hypothetical protein